MYSQIQEHTPKTAFPKAFDIVRKLPELMSTILIHNPLQIEVYTGYVQGSQHSYIHMEKIGTNWGIFTQNNSRETSFYTIEPSCLPEL
jgi:hypothetical protein